MEASIPEITAFAVDYINIYDAAANYYLRSPLAKMPQLHQFLT
jgi:hypothetical protein